MTAPYKIAVAAAATLLLVVIASLLLQPTPPATGDPAPAAIADGRPAPDPPPHALPGRPQPQPPQAPTPALPFDDPARPPKPAPPADPTRLQFTDPPPGAVFDVGRSPLDAQGKPRSSLFAPQPGTASTASPDAPGNPQPPAVPTGRPLSPSDPVAPPAVPTAAGTAPPAAQAPRALATAPTYTVKSGDNLSSIALDLYGSGTHWVQIAQANPLVDPDRLKVGQVIKLPGQPGTTPTIPPAVTPDRAPAPDVGAGTQYTVKENDTLSSIAKQFYNAASKWQLIYQANRQTIGGDPGRMRPGMVLTIPPPVSGAR